MNVSTPYLHACVCVMQAQVNVSTLCLHVYEGVTQASPHPS